MLLIVLAITCLAVWLLADRAQKAQHKLVAAPAAIDIDNLTRQVDELQDTVGTMIQTLEGMDQQFYAAYQQPFAYPAAQGYSMEPQLQLPQQLIQIEPTFGEMDPMSESPMVPDNMAPELLEKYRAIQALYSTMQHVAEQGQGLPSQFRPDLN